MGQLTYRNRIITILLSGWIEIYDDKQRRFVKFDSMPMAKQAIDELILIESET